MWGRAIECGVLENPWSSAPEEPYTLTRSPADAPSEPREVVVGFERGEPVSLDGKPTDLGRRSSASWARSWARTVGDGSTWSRTVGSASRAARSTNARRRSALVLAHQDLEGITLERDVAREKQRVEIRVAELIYDGLWHSPLMSALQAFVTDTQKEVTGEVRLRLEAGQCRAVGRRAPRAASTTTTWRRTTPKTCSATKTPEGFVRLWGLSAQTWSRRQGPGSRWPDRSERASEASGKPLWAGRFGEGPSDELLAFTVSLPYDRRLAGDDLAGSRARAHARTRRAARSSRSVR